MVTRFRYYLSCCLDSRKMFIVTACRLLSHYALIMDNSLILLLSMWILNWQPWRYWRKYYAMSANTVGLSQEYTRSKSEIGMLPWNQIFPQVGGWSIDVLLKLQTINYIKIRSMDTVLPQSRVEKDKEKHLLVVQKYSSGEISRE